MKRFRVGIIGCGFIAHHHMRAWREHKTVEVIAASDIREASARQLADEFGIGNVYTDGAEMLAREELDIVDIATPVYAHKDYFISAAEQGIHVLMEKPFAPSLADAEEMADCAIRNGVTTMVCQTYRWQRWLLSVKNVIDEGLIGTPFYANITQRIPFAVPFGPDGKIDLVEDQPFYTEVEKLTVLEMASHYVDALRFLFGEPLSIYAKIRRVSDHIRGDDLAVLILDLGNVLGVIEDSWVSAGQDVTNRVLVEGDQGMVLFPGTQGPPHAPTKTVVPLTVVTSSGEEEIREIDMTNFYTHSFELLQRHFLDCIESKQEPMTSAADNLKTLGVVFGAYQSAEQDAVVRFEE